MGVQALVDGARDEAVTVLDAIRQIERRWRIGQSLLVRSGVIVIALVIGAVAYAVVQLAMLTLLIIISDLEYAWERLLTMMENLRNGTWILLFVWMAIGIIHSFIALIEWPQYHDVDDCGDRLEAFIRSPRGIALSPSRADQAAQFVELEGLTAYQLLGLAAIFTLDELNAARRRLAAIYHPDKWRSASPSIQRASEDAMKRVNVAFEVLKPHARQ